MVSSVLYITQNKCVPYWPEVNGCKDVGPYVVSCISETDASDYKVRVLEMKNKVTQQAHSRQPPILFSPLCHTSPETRARKFH